jgi:hypothetical protein
VIATCGQVWSFPLVLAQLQLGELGQSTCLSTAHLPWAPSRNQEHFRCGLCRLQMLREYLRFRMG